MARQPWERAALPTAWRNFAPLSFSVLLACTLLASVGCSAASPASYGDYEDRPGTEEGPDCLDGTVLTLSGAAHSMAACQEVAAAMSTDPELLDHGVEFMTPFQCSSCVEQPGQSGCCEATITATLNPRILLQVRASRF